MDGGDLATWVGSSFAAIAAGATLWTLKSQREQIDEQRTFIGEQSATLALERAELMALAQDRREQQARAIRIEVTRLYVTVLNSSDSPITDVSCAIGAQPALRAVITDDDSSIVASLITAEIENRGQPTLDILGAGQKGWFQLPERATDLVTVAFTDAAGHDWKRDALGRLDQLTTG